MDTLMQGGRQQRLVGIPQWLAGRGWPTRFKEDESSGRKRREQAPTPMLLGDAC